MRTKNEAMELAHIIEDCMSGHLPVSRSEIAAMLRSQAVDIERLTESLSDACERDAHWNWQFVKAANERNQLKAKLEQLTSGDVELPEHEAIHKFMSAYTKDQLIDYGNHRAAQAVTEFLERSDKYLTNDATREAAIKAAVLIERERCLSLAHGYAKNNEDLAIAINRGEQA